MVDDPTVSIKHLNHYFGNKSLQQQILVDIHLEINPGEIVIITGPSGSGKTTLLTLIGALRSVQSGSLKVFGYELYRAKQQQLMPIRHQIRYIFQNSNLLKSLTAQQNVQMSIQLQKNISSQEVRLRAKTMLEAVGLGHRTNYYPRYLSGGEQQRVAIARALVSNPQLILADEPTAALDSQSGRVVMELMQELAKRQGCTILMTTHDRRILDIADRRFHIEDGHLTQSA